MYKMNGFEWSHAMWIISHALWLISILSVKSVQSEPTCRLVDDVLCDYFASAKETLCAQEWGIQNCRNMCGHPCNITQFQHIKDCTRADHVRCRDFHEKNEYYCRHPWMQKNCRYFCGSCEVEGSTEYHEMILPVVKTTVVRQKQKKKMVKKQDCSKADHKRCPDYHGYRDHYCQQTWMQLHCPHFCGICPPATLVELPYRNGWIIHPEAKKLGTRYLGLSKKKEPTSNGYLSKMGKEFQRPGMREDLVISEVVEPERKDRIDVPSSNGAERTKRVDPTPSPPQYIHKRRSRSALSHIVNLVCKQARKGCKKEDNFRCFLFKRLKYHVCHFDWMRENCKFMCGICVPKKHVKYHLDRLLNALEHDIDN